MTGIVESRIRIIVVGQWMVEKIVPMIVGIFLKPLWVIRILGGMWDASRNNQNDGDDYRDPECHV